MPINSGLKLLRARPYGNLHLESNIKELSYIPNEKSDLVRLGRLNKEKESIYYGCIYFDDEQGAINVAFSEVNANPSQTINVLRSVTTSDLNLHYIGIYDYIFRRVKPTFIRDEVYEYYSEVYQYQKDKFTEDVFISHILCDAFFSDILRRPCTGNLYKVTSILSSKIFSDYPNIDGIIYTSVKSEGNPVVALKTTSVEDKISHIKVDSFNILFDLGYGLFRANHTHCGVVDNNEISWHSKHV